jgi:hypothetical protein
MAEDRFTLEMGPGDFRNVTAAQVRQLGSPVRGRPDAFSDAAGNVFDLSLSPTVSAPTGSWGPADVWVPNAAAAPPALFSTPVAAPTPTGRWETTFGAADMPEKVWVPAAPETGISSLRGVPSPIATVAPAPTGVDLSIQEQMNLHPHLRLPTWVEPELRGWGGQEVYREGEFKGLTPPQARQRAVADALAGRLPAPGAGIGIFSYPGPASGGGEEGQSDSSYSPPGWESPTTHDKIGFVLENLAGKNVTLENYSKANALADKAFPGVRSVNAQEVRDAIPGYTMGAWIAYLAAPTAVKPFMKNPRSLWDEEKFSSIGLGSVTDEGPGGQYGLGPGPGPAWGTPGDITGGMEGSLGGMGQAGLGSYSSSFGVTGGTDPSGLGSYGEGTEGYYASGGLVSLQDGGDPGLLGAREDPSDLPKLRIDNPGKDWLAGKLRQAQEDYKTEVPATESSIRNISRANITGWWEPPQRRGLRFIDLPPELLKDFPGAMDEHKFRHKQYHPLDVRKNIKLDLLEEQIKKHGYRRDPILIAVREDGIPFIVEGNHRVAEALKSGRKSIPVEIRYLRGAEEAPGPLSPERVLDIVKSQRARDVANLPAVIDIAGDVAGAGVDEPRPKATGKGQMFRGIGSLMRRPIFRLVQAVQLGYEHLLTDEQKSEIEDFLSRPVHEALGMEKSGLESLKAHWDYVEQLESLRDYLGLEGSEPEGEAIALPAPELPMDEASRMARAKEMGFDVDAFHGTARPLSEPGSEEESDDQSIRMFGGSDAKLGTFVSDIGDWFSESPAVASHFAEETVGSRGEGARPQVYPVKIRLQNPELFDTYEDLEEAFQEWQDQQEYASDRGGAEYALWLQEGGRDGIVIENSTTDTGEQRKDYIVFSPKNIRSRFAKFDPAKKGSADIGHAAGGFVAKPLYDDARII